MGVEKMSVEFIELKCKPLSPLVGTKIPLPNPATPGSAGIDLRACIEEPVFLRPGARACIPCGFAVEIPAGFAGFVFARSGLAVRHGIALSNGVGVIDSDYRGEISVGLIHQGDTPYTIEPGERIAQLVVLPVAAVSIQLVQELDTSQRGTGGFGSTGKV